MVVVDVNNLKNGRKPVKLQRENPAGCAGEGKQSKGNIGEEKKEGLFIIQPIVFCDCNWWNFIFVVR